MAASSTPFIAVLSSATGVRPRAYTQNVFFIWDRSVVNSIINPDGDGRSPTITCIHNPKLLRTLVHTRKQSASVIASLTSRCSLRRKIYPAISPVNAQLRPINQL